MKNNSHAYKETYRENNKNASADMVKDDFEMDRVVIVAGWVLSITEARQCAALQLKKQ